MSDPVNTPDHYKIGGIELMDALEQSMTDSPNPSFVDFCRASAIQYLWRMGRKGDVRIEAGKARWYINRLIQYLESSELDERAEPLPPTPAAPAPKGLPLCQGGALPDCCGEVVAAGHGTCGGM